MRIRIQISGIKDIDLLALNANPQFNIAAGIADALRTFVRKTGNRIMLPPAGNKVSISLEPVQVNIPLDDMHDKDVIQFLRTLRPGCRSAAVKSIFRNELESPYLPAFLASDGEIKARTINVPEKVKTPQRTAQQPQKSRNIDQDTQNVRPEDTDEDGFDIFSDDFITNI